jgi:hypothetical protein
MDMTLERAERLVGILEKKIENIHKVLLGLSADDTYPDTKIYIYDRTTESREPIADLLGDEEVNEQIDAGLFEILELRESNLKAQLREAKALVESLQPKVQKFTVGMREVHVSHRVVMAKSPEEAMQLVKDGDGEETFLEYSHPLESANWDVTDESGKLVL